MSISSRRRFRRQPKLPDHRFGRPINQNLSLEKHHHSPANVSVREVRNRLIGVWLILMTGLVGLTINVFRLQIIEGSRLRQMARDQQQVTLKSFTPRHPITDRNDKVLGIDQHIYDLYVHPMLFTTSHADVANQLSPILDQPVGDLLYTFSQSDTGIRLANRLDPAVAQEIRKLELNGIDLDLRQQRYYPYGTLFSHIVGYVNVDQEGQIGVESIYQDRLIGKQTSVELTQTGQGSILPHSLSDQVIQRQALTLKLTLDGQLQQMVHQRLQAQLHQYDTDRGGAVVMDVADGSILALVNEPSFDPNTYFNADQATFRNWIISDAVEPGSTFKPINLAIALDNDVIQPEDMFYDGGFIQVGKWVIKNSDFDDYGGHGQISVADILRLSSNVGMIQIMQRLSSSVYFRWLERLGIEHLSGIDLPAEGAGDLKNVEEFTRGYVEAATASFGQGLSITPIRLLQLHAAIANGGQLVVPHVTQGLFDSRGNLQWEPPIPKPRTLFDEDSGQKVLDMMELVVERGTGKTAQIPNYRIAGKTGTAEKASDSGGYDETAKLMSFVSIFPVEAPQYVVLVMIDEPKGNNLFGSTVAAPVAKSIMEFMIASEAIPASNASSEQN